MSAAAHDILPEESKKRQEFLRKAKEALYIRARKDFYTFACVVTKDESGERVEMDQVHARLCRSAQSTRYGIFVAAPEMGKTVLGVALYALWRLGRNPATTIGIISSTKDRAKEIVASIKSYIEHDFDLKRVFPRLAQGEQWTETKIRVAGSGNAATPSVTALGVGSKDLLGKRLNALLLDDVDNELTVDTELNRKRQINYIRNQALNRLMPGGTAHLYCNAWHAEDVAHTLAKNPAWKLFKIPVVVTAAVLQQWPEWVGKLGESIWPKRWPMSRIEERKALTGHEEEWNRAYLCIPLRDGTSYFREKHFDIAKELGDGWGNPSNLRELLAEGGLEGEELDEEVSYYTGTGCAPYGWQEEITIVHGVDLATGVNRDLTAIVSLCWYREDDLIRPLRIQFGDWHVTEDLLPAMKKTHEDFGGTFIVENTGTQLIAVNLMADQMDRVPIIGFPTRRQNKMHVVRDISARYGNGQVVVPSHRGFATGHGIQELHDGLRAFNPKDHPSDVCAGAIFGFGMIEALRSNEFVMRGGRIEVAF